MGASRCCLLPVCLIFFGTTVALAQPLDGDRPPLEARQLVGQAGALVSAAQGKAFVLESVEGQPSARAIKTAMPAYKAFGLNASAERLLYRPLAGNAPSGELVVEDLATGAVARFSSHYALEAAWSPRDRDLLAFTFASGQGYGLALLNVRTRRLQVVWSDEVLADYLAWEADGSGVYFYRAVEKERVGVAGDSGLVVAEHSYAVLTASFHPLLARGARSRASEEVAPHTLPAGFPVLNNPAAEELGEPVVEQVDSATPLRAQSLRTPELPADLHAFHVFSPGGDREILGENLLADSSLSVRELPDGKPRLLGRGRLVRVTESGVLLRTANATGGTLEFVAWDGQQAAVAAAAAVSYGIPFPSAYITQGGQSFPSPNCSSYYTHKSTSSMGYANDMWNGAGHIMASAAGTAAYVKSDVTCNSCAGTGCADYRSGCASNSGWGNVVILEHADGTWTKYTHMRPGSARVSLGESVCAGYWIGTQGHTGCTSGGTCGDHLHFQRQSSSALSGQSLRIDFFDATNPLACYRSYPRASPSWAPAPRAASTPRSLPATGRASTSREPSSPAAPRWCGTRGRAAWGSTGAAGDPAVSFPSTPSPRASRAR